MRAGYEREERLGRELLFEGSGPARGAKRLGALEKSRVAVHRVRRHGHGSAARDGVAADPVVSDRLACDDPGWRIKAQGFLDYLFGEPQLRKIAERERPPPEGARDLLGKAMVCVGMMTKKVEGVGHRQGGSIGAREKEGLHLVAQLLVCHSPAIRVARLEQH